VPVPGGLVAADDLHPPVEILILAAATPGHTEDRSCVFILRRDMCFASPPVSPPTATGRKSWLPSCYPAGKELAPCTTSTDSCTTAGVATSKTQCHSRVPPYQMPPQRPPAQPDQGAPARRVAVLRRTRPGRAATPCGPLQQLPQPPPCPATGQVDLSPTTTTRTGHDRTATPHEMTPPQQRVYIRPTQRRGSRGSVAQANR
jgi:hypothetical protein